jgi:signal transduction histidine kinase
VNPLQSVGTRLSLALSFVVIGSSLVVYFLVVPSLQHRLVSAKMKQLESAVPVLRGQYERSSFVEPQAFADDASETTNARVVVLNPLGPGLMRDVADSSGNGGGVGDDPIALHAQATGDLERGTVARGGTRFAEVAIPVGTQTVILVSASLAPQLQTVHVLKRRLVIVGLVAFGVALALGYGGAWAFARRIRRLERAAERIAAGQFDEPVVDRSQDELGELARAFDRMRVRLAQLDDARREFIANASHELRTPLFSLGGFLELMADEDLDEETRQEFLTAMREQVARLTKLATDLLDLSRLDAGRMRIERQPLDLAPLARAVADEFIPVAQANGHQLEVVDASPASAVGDPDRVLQIGRVLVENALVHTPPGTPVRVRVQSENGSGILAVEDDGPGIPEEDLAQIFERFHRADGGRTSGSGLGLAIARELARLMDGELRLESRPGRTVFSLALPAPDEDRALAETTRRS